MSQIRIILALCLMAFIVMGASSCGQAEHEGDTAPFTTAAPATPDITTVPIDDIGTLGPDETDTIIEIEPSGRAYLVETPGSSASPATVTPTPEATLDFSGEVIRLFSNANDGVIRDGSARPVTITLVSPTRITAIQTYHWHGGKGVTPGTISLTGADGTIYGPFPTTGSDGQGGVPNAYWNAEPMVDLAPGDYTVADSDPATHGTNDEMNGAGQTIVYGIVAAP
jgi:hypothetical protein